MLLKINTKLHPILPKAVLFDTDNTLYDYHPANNAANLAVLAKAKNLIGIDEDTFQTYYVRAKYQIKDQLKGTASSHSRLLYFQRVLELLGFRAELLVALDLEQTFWRTFLANAPLFPYVVETLALLRANMIPIAIVTDLTSHIQLRKLTYFGLEDTFDAVVTSEEVGADKPDIRNFQLVLSKLGIKSSKDVWMIGDDSYTDIYGANSFGATTFQKLHGNIKLGQGDQTPDFTFTSFKDIIDLINPLIQTI